MQHSLEIKCRKDIEEIRKRIDRESCKYFMVGLGVVVGLAYGIDYLQKHPESYKPFLDFIWFLE